MASTTNFPAEHKTHVLALCNTKGGSNKSTASINIAAELATRGFQVLLVDLDHQADSTGALQADPEPALVTTNDVLLQQASLIDNLQATNIDTLWLLAANDSLYGLDTRLQAERPDDFHLILHHILVEQASGFDYVVLDCPGNMQVLSIMALAAADAYVVPMQPAFFFLKEAKKTIKKANGFTSAGLTPNLKLAGLFFSPYHPNRRSTATSVVVEAAENEFGELLLPYVRMDEKLAKAQMMRRPVQLDTPETNAAVDFASLTDAILTRMRWPVQNEEFEAWDREQQAQ